MDVCLNALVKKINFSSADRGRGLIKYFVAACNFSHWQAGSRLLVR